MLRCLVPKESRLLPQLVLFLRARVRLADRLSRLGRLVGAFRRRAPRRKPARGGHSPLRGRAFQTYYGQAVQSDPPSGRGGLLHPRHPGSKPARRGTRPGRLGAPPTRISRVAECGLLEARVASGGSVSMGCSVGFSVAPCDCVCRRARTHFPRPRRRRGGFVDLYRGALLPPVRRGGGLLQSPRSRRSPSARRGGGGACGGILDVVDDGVVMALLYPTGRPAPPSARRLQSRRIGFKRCHLRIGGNFCRARSLERLRSRLSSSLSD